MERLKEDNKTFFFSVYSLPVPNSIQHEQWAVDTMLEAWSRVAASGSAARARVKMDRP